MIYRGVYRQFSVHELTSLCNLLLLVLKMFSGVSWDADNEYDDDDTEGVDPELFGKMMANMGLLGDDASESRYNRWNSDDYDDMDMDFFGDPFDDDRDPFELDGDMFSPRGMFVVSASGV
jgi:hypothetical protein